MFSVSLVTVYEIFYDEAPIEAFIFLTNIFAQIFSKEKIHNFLNY